MKMMSIEELMNFWWQKAYEIAKEDNPNVKEKRALFIEAYTSYLFYEEAYEKHSDEAIREAEYRLGKSED